MLALLNARTAPSAVMFSVTSTVSFVPVVTCSVSPKAFDAGGAMLGIVRPLTRSEAVPPAARFPDDGCTEKNEPAPLSMMAENVVAGPLFVTVTVWPAVAATPHAIDPKLSVVGTAVRVG